jgi:hypothetical protein
MIESIKEEKGLIVEYILDIKNQILKQFSVIVEIEQLVHEDIDSPCYLNIE